MLQLAKQASEEALLTQVELRRGVIEELPVDSESVDWVNSNRVINLSPQKPKVFAEINRVLKPGGHMVLSDTVVDDVPDWMMNLVRRFSGAAEALIGERDYLQIVAESGLEGVKLLERKVFSDAKLRQMLLVEAGRFQTHAKGRGRQLLAACERAWLAPVVFVARNALSGRVSSIKVSARRSA